MASAPQQEVVPESIGDDDQVLSDDKDDEVALSPESKKVLENCSMPVPTLSENEARPLLSRPMSSGVNTTGFQFARPAYPPPRPTTRTQPSRPRAELLPEHGQGAPKEAGSTLQVGLHRTKRVHVSSQKVFQNSMLSSASSPSKSLDGHSTGDRTGSSPSTPEQPPRNTLPTFAGKGVQDRHGVTDSQKEQFAGQKRCFAAGNPLREEADVSRQSISGDGRQVPCENGTGTEILTYAVNDNQIPRNWGAQPRKTASPHPQVQSAVGPEKTKRGDISGHRGEQQMKQASKASRSPAFRITKSQDKSKTSTTQSPAVVASQVASGSQPSEEDLFHMLINRMKRRDEAEAAELGFREQIQAELYRAGEENKTLTAQLEQAMTRSGKQEAELTSQRNIIEKWRMKFNKLRNLVRGIGEDQETLRNDGQSIKAMQDSLNEHKTQVFEQLGDISKAAETAQENSSQQKGQISDIRQEFKDLNRSVALAEARAHDKEQALAREKARVATLEGFIKSSSNKNLKQTHAVQQKQLEAISKIDGLHKHIEDCSKGSQFALQTKLGNILSSSTEILTAINERRPEDSAQLEQISSSFKELYFKWDSHRDTTSEVLERSIREQGSRGAELIDRLHHIDTAFQSASKTADQLAEARELNGRLQEKLTGVESALELSDVDREKLRSSETDLKEQLSKLQTEVAALKKDMEDQSHGDTDAASEMQIQFDATSSALKEATENVSVKEDEIQSLKSELEETKNSLASSEVAVENLEVEKLQMQENASRIEQRVREELARASLKSKDRSRALFEQEQHKLKRERELAEKSVQSLSEQLEAVKCSLAEANTSREQLVTEATDHRKEMGQLKDELSTKSWETDQQVALMEEHHTICSSEKEDLRCQLNAIRQENEQLKLEASRSHANEDSANEMDLLQKRLDILQQKCTEKDENLATAQKQLEAFQENDSKRKSEFEDAITDKGAENESLRKQLEDTQQMQVEAEDRLQKSQQVIVDLTKQQNSLEKDSIETSTLCDTVQNKTDEIEKLQNRIQETDYWTTKMECLLKNLGLIGPQGSLSTCWDPLENRLRRITSQASQVQTPRIKRSLRSNARGAKRRPTPKGTTKTTPRRDRATPEVSTQEYQTTEIVYRQHSIRESKSVSPRKARPVEDQTPSKNQQGNAELPAPIKPFSQVQGVGNIQGQSSPLSQLTDLSSMFLTPPNGKGQSVSGNLRLEPSGEDSIGTANTFQAPATEGISKIGSQNSLKHRRPREYVAERGAQSSNANGHTLPLEDRSINISAVAPSKPSNEVTHEGFETQNGSAGHNVKMPCLPESRKDITASFTHCGSKDGGQSEGNKAQPKGILKDRTMHLSGQASVTGTPKREQQLGKPGARRRQSRTSSAYFDDGSVCSAAARSGGSVSKKRGPQVLDRPENSLAPSSRPKARRRTKGDRYNDRFSRIPQT